MLSGLSWRAAFRLARTTEQSPGVTHAFAGDEEARDRKKRDDKALVQFDYDASNEFYALFLDPQMVYSCACFPDQETGLATAQTAKLDLICKKLRLQPGERLLDIGCGWGAKRERRAFRRPSASRRIILN